jgi:hypothetical protein
MTGRSVLTRAAVPLLTRAAVPLLTRAAVLLLAGAGLAAIAVGRHESPAPEPPRTRPPAARLAAGADVLTRGRLLPASRPIKVEIPTLRASVPLTGLGLQPDGSMAVPADARTVGWFTEAPTPGSLGPAVLAGHVNFHGADGTFARLSTLRPGGQVRVTRQDGTVAVFVVTHVDRYAKDHFPSGAVYGPIDHAGLRLITCGGDFDGGTGHYRDNIVAYADLR